MSRQFKTDSDKADEFARKADQARGRMNRRAEQHFKEMQRQMAERMIEAQNLAFFGIGGPRGCYID